MADYLKKFFYIMSSTRRFMLLIGCFFVSSFLDTLGIGLVGPFMRLVGYPETIQQVPLLQNLYDWVGSSSANQFIALLGVVIVVIFCVKAFLSFQIQNYIFRFSYSQTGKVSSRLLHAYLSVPYTFHLRKNTSTLIQNIINETANFSNSVMIPLVYSISNATLLVFLLLLLASTSLVATFVIAAIVSLAFSINYKMRSQISTWGQRASDAQAEMIRVLNHSLGGIKETRTIGCEPYFENKMAEQIHIHAVNSGYAIVIGNLPRIMIEALLILFLVGFVSIYLTFTTSSGQELISILSIFTLASIRILPAASMLVNTYTTLRAHTYTVDKIYADLKEIEGWEEQEKKQLSLYGLGEPSKHRVLPFDREIVLDKISYRYPGVDELVLKDISLTIKKGQSIALIGRSGAGKTTLVDIILGLLVTDSGAIQVDGRSVYTDLRAWQNLIGYIPQTIFLIDDTIERNIAYGVPDDQIDPERLHQAIEAAQLGGFVAELPKGIQTVVGERGVLLSGGQRQRIGIARALYHEREILILDEATAALDNETEKLVMGAIQALSGTKTMILIAHRLSTVEHCDWVYRLERGQVVESGTFQEVVKNPDPR